MERRFSNRTDDQLETKWNTIKETFVKEHTCLSSSDLHYAKGEFDKMLYNISVKTGLTTSKIRRKIMRWDDSWLHFF